MDQLAVVLVLLPLLLAGLLYLEKKHRGVDRRRLPPAPRGLPVIGNLHQVGAIPHRALRALAAANGAPHLTRLRLGHVPAVVASSPAAAFELMRAHDHVFATRPYIRAAEIMTYGFRDMVFAPHGEHWRHVRRLCSEHVLSSSRSRRQNPMREQEVAALVQAVAGQASSHAGAVVDVSGVLYRFAHDVICRVVCGRHSREEAGRSELFRELIKENAALMGGFRVGDYFPALAWADALLPGAGGGTRARRNSRRWDELLEKVVQEHEGRRGGRGDDDGGKEEDFVDVLLALQEEGGQDGFELSREIVKSLMGDMFAAGTDTTYIVLEWAMSELMKNPSTMRKLEHEVRSRSAGGIAKADTLGAATTPYLKAVVKETLRLHPPTPLLLPRECMQDATVMGYHVAKGTLVLVNAWAINRDPASWHQPDEFLPERFLESEVDFRGGHFQFIPFGAGRRICPGMQFGLATIELALANLVRIFNWELPDGMAPGELDMSDTPGLTTPRRVGLRLIARSYQWEKQE